MLTALRVLICKLTTSVTLSSLEVRYCSLQFDRQHDPYGACGNSQSDLSNEPEFTCIASSCDTSVPIDEHVQRQTRLFVPQAVQEQDQLILKSPRGRGVGTTGPRRR